MAGQRISSSQENQHISVQFYSTSRFTPAIPIQGGFVEKQPAHGDFRVALGAAREARTGTESSGGLEQPQGHTTPQSLC